MIKLVSVHDKKPATIGSSVMKFLGDFEDTGLLNELLQHWLAQKVVMVADGETDARSAASQFHQTGNNQIALWLPVPAFLQAPAINEIADQIEIFRFVPHQKIQQLADP